jgi:hypothetical protein
MVMQQTVLSLFHCQHMADAAPVQLLMALLLKCQLHPTGLAPAVSLLLPR